MPLAIKSKWMKCLVERLVVPHCTGKFYLEGNMLSSVHSFLIVFETKFLRLTERVKDSLFLLQGNVNNQALLRR